ncbi:MAG TPA: FAD-dependent oxidoreductase [Verrucomicrobiae bacterium]|nr:FAD-dependent oxidoreductase [Verrucomicrobiae bacterium]
MPARPGPSWWLDRARPPLRPALEGDRRCDVVIVGGGLTGLWSAIRLIEADPGCRVIVLEQSTVGFGASGCNGGFAMTMMARNLHDLARKLGAAPAQAVPLQMVETLAEIEAFCLAEGLAAELTRPGLLTVSNGPEQDVRIL